MSERPPPGVAENRTDHRPEALTPEVIESVLADFRSWLHELARSPAAGGGPPVRNEELEPVDLHTLLGQMAALRHEVHLQTRAVRGQQEQSVEALKQLDAALEALRETRSSERQADEAAEEELLRPLIKALVDLYDSLSLATREVQRVQEAAESPEPDVNEPEPVEPKDRTQAALDLVREWEEARSRVPKPGEAQPAGMLARWFGRAEPAAPAGERAALATAEKVIAALRDALVSQSQREEPAEENEEVYRLRAMLDSVLTGYTMSLQRVERALEQAGLEPIDCVGWPFDPEQMEVLDVAGDTGRPTGEVVEEIRRGYLWRGRVFRYAQVRVAKS